MGLMVVSLSTAYAFAEFFGLSGSLNDSVQEEQDLLYPFWLVKCSIAAVVAMIGSISLFQDRYSDPDHQCDSAYRWSFFT